MIRSFRYIALCSLLMGLMTPANAQDWHLSEASQLWLAGTSSINSFECQAKAMTFDYDVPHEIRGSGFSLPGMALVVPVRDLDCANRRMNRDMYETMRAEVYPEIRLEVHRIDLVPESSDSQATHADQEQMVAPEVAIHGSMALAGVSRDITIRMRGWLDEALRLHGTGTLDVKMTDFDMVPPTALFGLIKAHDDISIRFHLVAESAGDMSQALQTVQPATPQDSTPTRMESTGNIQ